MSTAEIFAAWFLGTVLWFGGVAGAVSCALLEIRLEEKHGPSITIALGLGFAACCAISGATGLITILVVRLSP